MLRPGYAPLLARWLWLKLRWRGRLVTDGLCFVCPGVKFEIGPDARVVLGRWSWVGDGCKIRAHEGVIAIGAKSVLGQECTLSCYQQISIGRECIVADRTMMIDFDHGTAEVDRAIREQGIYKRDVRVGHNVWIGYGACILRVSRSGTTPSSAPARSSQGMCLKMRSSAACRRGCCGCASTPRRCATSSSARGRARGCGHTACRSPL